MWTMSPGEAGGFSLAEADFEEIRARMSERATIFDRCREGMFMIKRLKLYRELRARRRSRRGYGTET